VLEKEFPEQQKKGMGGAQKSTSNSRDQDGAITAGEEECKNRRSPIKEPNETYPKNQWIKEDDFEIRRRYNNGYS